jgi:hypothetical protein
MIVRIGERRHEFRPLILPSLGNPAVLKQSGRPRRKDLCRDRLQFFRATHQPLSPLEPRFDAQKSRPLVQS